MGRVEGWGGAPDWAHPVRPSALLDLGTGLQVGGTLRYSPRGGSPDRAGPGGAGPEVGGALGCPPPSRCQDRAGPGGAGPEMGGALGLPRPRRCRGCIPGSLARGGGAPRLSLRSPLGAGVGTGRSWERGRGGPR